MSHRYRIAFRETLCGRRRRSQFSTNGYSINQSSFHETTIAETGCPQENSRLVRKLFPCRLHGRQRLLAGSWYHVIFLFASYRGFNLNCNTISKATTGTLLRTKKLGVGAKTVTRVKECEIGGMNEVWFFFHSSTLTFIRPHFSSQDEPFLSLSSTSCGFCLLCAITRKLWASSAVISIHYEYLKIHHIADIKTLSLCPLLDVLKPPTSYFARQRSLVASSFLPWLPRDQLTTQIVHQGNLTKLVMESWSWR